MQIKSYESHNYTKFNSFEICISSLFNYINYIRKCQMKLCSPSTVLPKRFGWEDCFRRAVVLVSRQGFQFFRLLLQQSCCKRVEACGWWGCILNSCTRVSLFVIVYCGYQVEILASEYMFVFQTWRISWRIPVIATGKSPWLVCYITSEMGGFLIFFINMDGEMRPLLWASILVLQSSIWVNQQDMTSPI